jgi:hypothetical protein
MRGNACLQALQGGHSFGRTAGLFVRGRPPVEDFIVSGGGCFALLLARADAAEILHLGKQQKQAKHGHHTMRAALVLGMRVLGCERSRGGFGVYLDGQHCIRLVCFGTSTTNTKVVRVLGCGA